MDLETLKREAETLVRPAVLLSLEEAGDVLAWWYEPPLVGVVAAVRRGVTTLTVSPEASVNRQVLSVAQPPAGGVPLYGRPHKSMPPIEAIFLLGSDVVGEWLKENKWDRSWGYNDNFPDSSIVAAYERWWQSEHPFYSGEGVALMGGWHFVWPDDDWYELVREELVLWTLRSEPWVEVWAADQGYRLVKRVT